MNPHLALLFCVVLTIIVSRIDNGDRYKYSKALIIPLLWFLIILSRNPSLWISPIRNVSFSPNAVMEGNPVNRYFFSALTFVGVIVLYKRQIDWAKIIKRNGIIFIIYAYYILSILWSDYPNITIKRIIRDIGNPVMLFILLTDKNSVKAVGYIFKHCAFLFMPLSIIYYKYIPQLGRNYHSITGEMSITGVSQQKNGLGALCMLCSFYLIWHIINIYKKNGNRVSHSKSIYICLIYLSMSLWLLVESSSATSLMTLLIAISIIFLLDIPIVKNNLQSIGVFIIAALILFAILQISFNIFQITVEALGKDPTLTGRTVLWETCINMKTNPIVGVGYDNFWLGSRLRYLSDTFWWQPNESHSGYVETYLDQGFVGIFLLTILIISTYNKIKTDLQFNFNYGKFRMALFIVAIIYNVTEAAFKGLAALWFTLLMISIVDSPEVFNREENELLNQSLN